MKTDWVVLLRLADASTPPVCSLPDSLVKQKTLCSLHIEKGFKEVE